jgi:hypothetical protein
MKSDDKMVLTLVGAFLTLILGGFAVGGWIDTNSDNIEKEKFKVCIDAGRSYEDGNCK